MIHSSSSCQRGVTYFLCLCDQVTFTQSATWEPCVNQSETPMYGSIQLVVDGWCHNPTSLCAANPMQHYSFKLPQNLKNVFLYVKQCEHQWVLSWDLVLSSCLFCPVFPSFNRPDRMLQMNNKMSLFFKCKISHDMEDWKPKDTSSIVATNVSQHDVSFSHSLCLLLLQIKHYFLLFLAYGFYLLALNIILEAILDQHVYVPWNTTVLWDWPFSP